MAQTTTAETRRAGAAFFAKTATPVEWRLVAAAIKNVTEEATFRVGPDGLQFASMTPDHMRELIVDWPAKAFHKFTCPAPTSLTVVADQFQKALARAGNDDSVEVATTGETGLLRLSFRGTEQKDFELHLLGEKEAPKIPNVELPTTVVLAPGVFDGALGDIAVVSGEFRLLVTRDFVRFSGGDLDGGNAKTELAKGNPGLLKLEGAESTSIYSVEQVEPIIRALKGAQSIEASFGTNKPLRLRFKLNDQGALATFYTTPRHVNQDAEAGEPAGEAKAN